MQKKKKKVLKKHLLHIQMTLSYGHADMKKSKFLLFCEHPVCHWQLPLMNVLDAVFGVGCCSLQNNDNDIVKLFRSNVWQSVCTLLSSKVLKMQCILLPVLLTQTKMINKFWDKSITKFGTNKETDTNAMYRLGDYLLPSRGRCATTVTVLLTLSMLSSACSGMCRSCDCYSQAKWNDN